jgi:glutamate dehydrogenase (NAD(P)+)
MIKNFNSRCNLFSNSKRGSFKFAKIPKHNFSTPDVEQLKSEPKFLEMVKLYFDKASEYLDIPRYYVDVIKNAKAVVRLNFPLVRDDGSIEVIQGFRSQHSLHYLPTKGGTRYADHIGKIKRCYYY